MACAVGIKLGGASGVEPGTRVDCCPKALKAFAVLLVLFRSGVPLGIAANAAAAPAKAALAKLGLLTIVFEF